MFRLLGRTPTTGSNENKTTTIIVKNSPNNNAQWKGTDSVFFLFKRLIIFLNFFRIPQIHPFQPLNNAKFLLLPSLDEVIIFLQVGLVLSLLIHVDLFLCKKILHQILLLVQNQILL